MGKAIRACALVLLLAYSASAGIIQNDKTQPPPPPPPATQSVQEPTTDGQEMTTEVRPETLLLIRVALTLLMLL